MRFRAWTFRPKAQPDELLSSWLARVAFAHGQTPYVFHNLHLPGLAVWNRDTDRAFTPGFLTGLSAVSGVDMKNIRAATLDRYRGLLGEAAPVFGEWPFILAAGVYHRKRQRHGLQYCPDCLDGGIPYYRRIWRLSFLLQCPSCATPMFDACPHCEAPVVPHRAPARLKICHQCGGNLCKVGADANSGVFAPALKLQKVLTAATERRSVEWLGMSQKPTECLRAVAILLKMVPARHIEACRAAIGLPTSSGLTVSSERFERQRLRERAYRMQTVSHWASRWPENFRIGAAALGLTRRTFLGIRVPAPLAREVSRLPSGQTRPRSRQPLLLGADLRRVRRESVTRYRHMRAARLLRAAEIE